jgi:PAS domain S-box-containing protein
MPTLTSDARIRVKHALQTGLREPPPTFCALTGRLHESIDLKTTQKTITWLAAALVLLAAGIAYNFWSYQQISAASSHRYHTRNVISMASDLLLDLKDAEIGQRGYLLTRNETYLAPYLAVRDGIDGKYQALRQLSTLAAGNQHLNAMAPLISAGMAEFARSIEQRRSSSARLAQVPANSEDGKRMMDQIRTEMDGFIDTQTRAQMLSDTNFDTSMRRLLLTLVISAVLAFFLAVFIARLMYQKSRQQIKDKIHSETQYLLSAQEASNELLAQTNRQLRDQEQTLSVTLSSIGDAVIATDAQACVTLLNPVAQLLSGWTQAEAIGQPIDKVLHIINKQTRELTKIPVADTLAHGTVHGLANHTVLVSRDGREFDIADSCAPIRAEDGRVIGAVLVFRNVTEEYVVQQSLRDSAALVQTILNTVVDGIVTIHAHGGVIETANPAIEDMFGYAATELAGKHLGLLIPELDQEQHNVSLAYYGASEEARAIGAGREVMGRRKNGSAFPLEIAVSEMMLGGQRYFTGILRDISTRKAAEAELLKSGALQKAIFDSANFSSIATDAKGVIQIFNVGAERMLGYAAVDVINKITPAEISDPQELISRAKSLSTELETSISPGFEALVFKASRGIEDIYELTYLRKDGSRLPAVVSVTALRDDFKAIIGYLLIGTDNTARKAAEVERARLDQVLRDKNTELEAARSVADKANLAKSEFLSSMSHELRSPLNAILGFAQLMESGSPEPTVVQRASIDQILKAGWYLLELINEVLDLALIESGRLSISVEPTSLPDVLEDCQTMIEPMAQKREISLHFPKLDASCFVGADRTRLKQVVINLLSNAIKYNRIGGSVTVTCSQRGKTRLRISVRDTGEGLSPSDVAQLFQPFNRLGKENSEEQGTGIGLVVSKRLMEQMGGEMGVSSTLGTGSVFWIELDIAGAPQLHGELTEFPLFAGEVDDDTDLTRIRTLLYVEDNRANMELVRQLIARRPDMRLLGAEDALRGIALAKAHQPDVILMDINLPGISGLQALKLLRDDPATLHIPVLALSANAMVRDIEKGLEAGFFRYLTKPIRVNEFMMALDEGLVLASLATKFDN